MQVLTAMLLLPVTWIPLSELFILLDYLVFQHLVFWSSSLKSLDLCPQLCEPLACSPNSSMQNAVLSIVGLKVLLIGLLLLCAVDGSVLQEIIWYLLRAWGFRG